MTAAESAREPDAAKTSRDSANWAAKVDRLHVADSARRYGYNIEGMRVSGPMTGFGRLWQRSYSVNLGAATAPELLVANWRAHFGEYWPKSGRFHGAVSAISPGDVAPLTAGGIATGILVLYADDTSFTFLTPEGHMFAAMITFSGERAEDGTTVAQIRMLLRNSDPIWEAAWPVTRRAEDAFWTGTLRNLAAAHGVAAELIEGSTQCVDRRRMWKNWTNVRRNAGIRTAWHIVTTPFRPRPGQPAA